MVLLHGFPEFWYSWRHQIPALVAAGFRVVVPDMRGYNLSEKPRGVESYRLEHLAGDISELISHLGESRAVVVGHDWGGVVSWVVAAQHAERVAALVVINAPHPGRFGHDVLNSNQALRSLYVGFFQLPLVPEAVTRAHNFAALRRFLRLGPARRDTFTETDIDRYVEAAARPGALTATLNYYRAVFRDMLRRRPWTERPVRAPVLVVWGERDPWLRRELADPGNQAVGSVRIHRLSEAGHWPHLEHPDAVNEALVAFLGAHSS